MAGVPMLAEVLAALEDIAPLAGAAEWDNVGLLIVPRGRRRRIDRILLTIDLTEAVAAEARRKKADLVVAYHPAIFRPLRRLDVADGKQRAILHAATAGFAVYSPHTALDGVEGGIADWIADCVSAGDAERDRVACGEGGFGRVIELSRSLPFDKLLQRVKEGFGVPHLQIARPGGRGRAVRRIGVAAGAGGGVLRGEDADVFVTGEMSHHDVLAAVAAGTSVVLAGHSNTERRYLGVLRRRLLEALDHRSSISISRADRDPLTVV